MLLIWQTTHPALTASRWLHCGRTEPCLVRLFTHLTYDRKIRAEDRGSVRSERLKGKWAESPQGAVKSNSAGLKQELLKINERLEILSFLSLTHLFPPIWSCWSSKNWSSEMWLWLPTIDLFFFTPFLSFLLSLIFFGAGIWGTCWLSTVAQVDKLCSLFLVNDTQLFLRSLLKKHLYLDHWEKFRHRNKTLAVRSGWVFNSLQVWGTEGSLDVPFGSSVVQSPGAAESSVASSN